MASRAELLDPSRRAREYALRAEARAVEEGHEARRVAERTYRVVSETWPDRRYLVRLAAGGAGAPLEVSCSCPSGMHRDHLPAPCKHAALVARRLEREGAVEWRDGMWWHPGERQPTPRPTDPFRGLAPPDDPWR